MTTYKWTINQLNRQTSDNFVLSAEWQCEAKDNDASVFTFGTSHFSSELTTPYENLTEEQVLGWVWANGIDKDATEASLATQIEAQKNPVTATGVPW